MNNLLLPTTLTLAMLAGCTGRTPILEDTRFQASARTMVADQDYSSLVNVNLDEGTLTRWTPDAGPNAVETLDFGADSEPTRVVRAGDTFYVTLRGAGEVAVVRGMSVVDRIPVGCEPFGMAIDEAGEHLYVAISQEDKVLHIDTASHQVTGEIAVGNDPRWLALHPRGERLYIGSARGGQVHSAELGSDGTPNGELEAVLLPGTERTVGALVFDNTVRVMGDLAVDAYGEHLVVPTLYVDNNSQQQGLAAGVDPTTGYYMNPEPGVGRFNPALVQIPLKNDGDVDSDEAHPIFLAGFVEVDWATEIVRSYPNSVTISPDGQYYAASMEASDAVVVVGALDYDRNATNDWWIESSAEINPSGHGFGEHPHSSIELQRGSGPASVVFTRFGDEPEAYVHTWLDLQVRDLAIEPTIDKVKQRGQEGLDDIESHTAVVTAAARVAESVLPNDVRRGRRLFYGARNSDMVATSSGVSCSTCHYEGRDDGLTWQLGLDTPRQTPSLAGVVSETHPVTWTNDVESVAAEALETSTVRMGGFVQDEEQYQAIQAFVDYTRVPVIPLENLDDPRIALGEEIFNRDEVGCATCHDPNNAFADGEHHAMYGLDAVNTPTLRGIRATAPYLHDGRAPTLREVLEISRSGEMGDTSSLSSEEMDALEAYLESL